MELYYIILAISVIFIGYFAFLYFNRSNEPMTYLPATHDVNIEEGMVPAPLPQPTPTPMPVARMQEEQPMNEYEDNHGSADMDEGMRNPERMFRPAPDNTGVPQSGMMGVPMGAGYEREPVMNEGEFMPGISAYETDGPKNFSMF
jgi:hypothetical protein